MQQFENQVIDIESLPKFENILYSKLEARSWFVVLIHISIATIFCAIAIFLFVWFNAELHKFKIIIAVLFLTIVAAIFALKRVGFNNKNYTFRTHDLLFKFGILSSSVTIIPYNRVQHVELQQSFFERYFDLATVKIFTAGAESSDVSIPGLTKDAAQRIKELVLSKIQNNLS